MRRLSILGICLATVCSTAALSTSAASAAPGWWACQRAVPVNSGHYSDKLCTAAVESGGKYELVPGVGKGKGFKGKGNQAVLHIVVPGVGDTKVECGGVKDSGNVAAPNRELRVTLAFSKCVLMGSPCANFSTPSLAGELGWLDKEAGEVGIALSNESAPGSGSIAQIECPGLLGVRIHGAFIGVQKGDIHEISKVTTVTYIVGSFLGEPSPGYQPIVNQPAFEEGPVGVLLSELNDAETHEEWAPEGGLASGLEVNGPPAHQGILIKGETLLIQ
ncbi:MAG TPA: hypothetical protein VH061_01010 [Solirubrobacteraceae bacterium]|jgi:hypothetical protein|nr:hypothetical protein [Solirubrobacteraceae bacterium]